MRAYTYSIHVDRSPEKVWAFLTDLTQAARWRAGFRLMEVVGGGPLEAGAEIRVVTEAMGRVADRTVRTTVLEPPHKWVTASASNGMSGEFTYLVERDGTGSKVSTMCDLHAHRFLPWLFLPMIARQERRWRAGQMEAFRKACEASV